MVAWLLGGLLVVLVAIHMARPRFKEFTLSAARFFNALPPARKGQPRLRLGNPFKSWPLYLQFPILLLLLVAVLSIDDTFAGGESKGLGVWFMVDTSASMSTSQQGTTRMDAAQEEIKQAMMQAKSAVGSALLSEEELLNQFVDQKKTSFCLKLSAFDLEQRDLIVSPDAKATEQTANELIARPLGTDLNLIRTALSLLEDQSESECVITHLIVVSDQPAPEWVADEQITSITDVIWRDVGQAVDNIGFTDIQLSQNPLTGLVREVNLEVTAFGVAPTNSKLLITAPDGTALLDEPIAWQGNNKSRHTFAPSGAGQYTLQLSPGGAYDYDDEAIIEISDGEQIRVDWQLNERGLVEQLGWPQEKQQPHLRIVPYQSQIDDIPTLMVGNGYPQEGANSGQPDELIEIRDFYESSPLLADLNFDVAESLGIRGVNQSSLPEGFQPVLRGNDDLIWLAQREKPPAAYVPGLPIAVDDNLGHFSTTAFFNAVRWLLQERPLPAPYTLTTPEEPEPEGNRLALHEEEGNTAREPYSFGNLDNLEPVSTGSERAPIWPILLAVAVLIFLIERGLAAFGSEKWR